MTIQAVESVRREVVVPLSPARAFDAFAAGMTTWWPRHHHIGETDIQDVVVEPREAGRWYTRHVDGSETSTGSVLTWEPARRLVLTWQIGSDWKYHRELLTTLEVRFVEEAGDRTRVEFEHRDLDRYGSEAEQMRQMFEEPGAWSAVMDAFAAGVAGDRGPRGQ